MHSVLCTLYPYLMQTNGTVWQINATVWQINGGGQQMAGAAGHLVNLKSKGAFTGRRAQPHRRQLQGSVPIGPPAPLPPPPPH